MSSQRLIDIIEDFISGDWGSDIATPEMPCAVSCIRGATSFLYPTVDMRISRHNFDEFF